MKILFAGGGTLGHVIPALSIINYENHQHKKFREINEIYYIAGSDGIEVPIIKKNLKEENIYCISMKGFSRKFFGLNLSNIKLYKLYQHARENIKEYYDKIRPDIVIGMGGYISYVSVKVALEMNIKTMLHEQNACFGLANLLLKNKVDKTLVSYDKLDKKPNVVFTGNPRVTEVYKNYNKLNCVIKRSVLVVGGSRGADKINDLILDLARFFEEEKILCTIITGKRYYIKNRLKIEKSTNKYLKIIPFSDDLIYHLLRSEVVISRGGATTISEVCALNKPCIYIPSPNVTNNHQYKNVVELVKKGCAKMIVEKTLSEELLKKEIINMFKHDLSNISKNLKQINKNDSIEKFINCIYEVYNG